jgi:ABC-type branched-subunit amino acid transport system ATPase component
MTLLSINKLNKHFGGLHAVNNVTFDVKEGSIQAVIGPMVLVKQPSLTLFQVH